MRMNSRVQKWGNSLAVRIPKTLADEIGLREDSPVDLALDGGALVIVPRPDGALSLDDLLAGVTDGNLHPEKETAAAGREVW